MPNIVTPYYNIPLYNIFITKINKYSTYFILRVNQRRPRVEAFDILLLFFLSNLISLYYIILPFPMNIWFFET